MNKLVVGNWKMNPQTIKEAEELVQHIEKKLTEGEISTDVVICPPFVFLAKFAHLKNIKLGAQNLSWAQEGPLTGEISATELKQLGVQYVILGHSERRMNLGETDSVVNAKLIEAMKRNLTPILCLGGEPGAIEKEMKIVVAKQFVRCTKGLTKDDLKKIVFAYEPIWAISTMKKSKPASSEHARDQIEHIYQILARHMPEHEARGIRVIYGGTVNQDNVNKYAKHPVIQGALVGAASLDPDNFWEIISEFDRESIHKS